MPDPNRLLNTLRQAAEAFRATPGRRGRFIELANVDEVFVAGDLHGNLANFKKILDLADLSGHPRRHLVLQELIHGPDRYGNFGGDQSHRLLDVVAALKCQYPERVHILMGNHELAQWTKRAILKAEENVNELFSQGVRTAYGDRSEEIYAAYEHLFSVLPAAIRTPNRIFLSHSLPAGTRLEKWELASVCKDEWQDADIKLGGCLHALVWGRDTLEETAERFLRKVDADLLITGHIPCDDGYEVPNSRQIILDCMGEKACCCLFPTGRALTAEKLLKCIVHL